MSSNETTTMQAITQDAYGNAGVLHLSALSRPEAAANEVLLQVRAAGLDRGTWHLMAGLPYLMRPFVGFRGPRNPVPGLDVTGQKTSDLEQLTGFIEAGQVTPRIDRTYPLPQAPEAMRRLEAGEVRGKIAITP